ncbi:MAG: aminopeptidase, partial [Patescibacteria group bacterium]|nr:aminopeptidase [Patescibacteria group bacterium]
VMKQCMAVKAGESVLIVTDPARSDLAGIFTTAAKEITTKIEVVSFSSMTENAQEPPPPIQHLMARSGHCLLVTTYSLSHTQARKQACAAGCRIASMPGITRDIIIRTLQADYSTIAKLSQKLAQILTKGKIARLTSPAGTNIRFDLTNRKGFADTGIYTKKGAFGNLPAGEACIGPLEGKTQGQLVIDGAFAGLELDSPINLVIKNGYVTQITGKKAADNLKKLIDQIGSKAGNIAELGIGTNPLAKLSPNVLEAEKVFGTCHVALGSNISYGGKIDVPFHSDGIVLQPTLQIDGKIIIKAGKFLL